MDVIKIRAMKHCYSDATGETSDLLNAVKSFYSRATSMVKVNGHESGNCEAQAGVRMVM